MLVEGVYGDVGLGDVGLGDVGLRDLVLGDGCWVGEIQHNLHSFSLLYTLFQPQLFKTKQLKWGMGDVGLVRYATVYPASLSFTLYSNPDLIKNKQLLRAGGEGVATWCLAGEIWHNFPSFSLLYTLFQLIENKQLVWDH